MTLDLPYKSSGAMYFKVPASILSISKLEHIPAIPKSTIFKLGKVFLSICFVNKRFSNLRSL